MFMFFFPYTKQIHKLTTNTHTQTHAHTHTHTHKYTKNTTNSQLECEHYFSKSWTVASSFVLNYD